MLDDQSLHGKVVIGVAQLAASFGRPVIAVAGQVRLGKRDLASAGIDAAYSVADLVGKEQAMNQPFESAIRATSRVARTWGRGAGATERH
jgi:glycerate kinase